MRQVWAPLVAPTASPLPVLYLSQRRSAPLETGSVLVQRPVFREPAAVRNEHRAVRNKEGDVNGVGDVALRDGISIQL